MENIKKAGRPVGATKACTRSRLYQARCTDAEHQMLKNYLKNVRMYGIKNCEDEKCI